MNKFFISAFVTFFTSTSVLAVEDPVKVKDKDSQVYEIIYNNAKLFNSLKLAEMAELEAPVEEDEGVGGDEEIIVGDEGDGDEGKDEGGVCTVEAGNCSKDAEFDPKTGVCTKNCDPVEDDKDESSCEKGVNCGKDAVFDDKDVCVENCTIM